MQSIRWLALLTAALIITACFFKWVSIEADHFYIGGFFSSDNRYGDPGILHLVFCLVYIVFISINRIWSVRTAFFVAAFNIAWALRNFVLISACSGGECPEKHTGLYVILIGSILLAIMTPMIRMNRKRQL